MPPSSFPEPLGARFRWIARESLVVAGILAVWIVVAVVVTVVLGVVAFLVQALRIEAFRFVYEFAGRSDLLWPAVTQLSLATTTLYVLVRAGTVLVDRYRAPLDD